MKNAKRLPPPAGYVRNQFGFIISEAWARKRMKEDDRAIYNRLKIETETNSQKAFEDFCREYIEAHHHDYALDELDD